MLIACSISLISAAAIIFFSHRLLCYLRHFQEGKYSRRQFKNWLLANGVYDKKGSLIAAITAVLLELTEERNIIIALVVCAIGSITLIWLSLWESDPRKSEFSKLQETEKATAIYNLALGLYSIAFSLVVIVTYKLGARDDLACYWLLVIVAIQSSPIWVVLASTLLRRTI
jgi:UDP-N-acetylmuramoyl-tripeptide--D-alanyl-D-alanine ligase